jgi:hypothetical protein
MSPIKVFANTRLRRTVNALVDEAGAGAGYGSDIATLQSEMDTAQGDIDTLESSVAALQTQVKVSMSFYQAGTLSVATIGPMMVIPPGTTWRLDTITLGIREAPTGQALKVQVHPSGGAGAFSTPPEIAAGHYQSTTAFLANTTLGGGGYYSLEITQVGSSVAGADLMITVYLTRTIA